MANVRCTMGNEDKKEYLKQYRRACRKLEALQEQAQSLKELESSAKAQHISDMPRGSSGRSDLADIIIKLEELQSKIDDKIKESLELRLEIENAILTVEGAEEVMVLRMRYIEFMRWEDIAEHMKYATAQIYRIHGRAIKQLKLKKIKDDSK